MWFCPSVIHNTCEQMFIHDLSLFLTHVQLFISERPLFEMGCFYLLVPEGSLYTKITNSVVKLGNISLNSLLLMILQAAFKNVESLGFYVASLMIHGPNSCLRYRI